jgi:hypothetical protein
MFISLKYSGYNRHDEQSAAGPFLILMQPATDSAKYRNASPYCHECGLIREAHDRPLVPSCPEHGIVARLKAIGEAKRHSDDSLVDEILANEKYVDGCATCEARKEYASYCNDFRPHAIAYPLRGIVRYVRMRQFGQFMMGSAKVGKTRLVLSGSYGSDGLPKSVPDEVYEMGLPLPQELYEAWNKGGGWNSAGREGEAMRRWAKANLITGRKK